MTDEIIMTTPQTTQTRDHRSLLTLLATTALAVSNLIVGILQNNAFLMIASAVLAALFAAVYMIRLRRQGATDRSASTSATADRRRSQKFPFFVFVGILFVALPALFWLMQRLQPGA